MGKTTNEKIEELILSVHKYLDLLHYSSEMLREIDWKYQEVSDLLGIKTTLANERFLSSIHDQLSIYYRLVDENMCLDGYLRNLGNTINTKNRNSTQPVQRALPQSPHKKAEPLENRPE